ncbi:unnamed protein product [Euphydryas editha]|uniref:CUB domain-containing protein n=1 Tax=Euphydryas editha TaxID=104508 RepID=A0AAU9UH28_EUPED|nr:unnamed protein product [Euphydryas editha]
MTNNKYISIVSVCSTFGVTSEQIADYNTKHKSMQNKMEPIHRVVKDAVDSLNLNKETRTNVNNKVNDNSISYKMNNYDKTIVRDSFNKFDEIYTENEDVFERNLNIHKEQVDKTRGKNFRNDFKSIFLQRKRRVKREDETDPRCEKFYYNNIDQKYITHPHGNANNQFYYSDLNCVTIIKGPAGHVVELTFVDVFHIEYHSECAYDFLEIRDGVKGYARLLGKVCGEAFPRQIISTGPNVWLKFHSDDTIEYEGFQININFIPSSNSISVPDSCYFEMSGTHGTIDSDNIKEECLLQSMNQALDVLWTIRVAETHKIYLNFTSYALAKPNECELNFVQVFGYKLEFDSRLAFYCGSVANPINTMDELKGGTNEKANIIHVRLYASKATGKKSNFTAVFTAFRSLDTSKDSDKCTDDEFDCQDNTCIDINLRCNDYANCRLKADEEKEICTVITDSMINQTHIKVILIIFCLILSGMSFVFFFKCIRKLYQDHKIIKEHIRQSCEDRLDSMVSDRLTLDAKRLERDSEPRASLERDNQTNEMFKQQRKFSQQKFRPPSIDSDFIQETQLNLDDEPWRREVNSVPVETENVRIERNGRTRRNDMSKREESIRSKKESSEKKQIRDVSVGAPDTKESGCQTRESLFQTDPAISSDGKIFTMFYKSKVIFLELKNLLSSHSRVVCENFINADGRWFDSLS